MPTRGWETVDPSVNDVEGGYRRRLSRFRSARDTVAVQLARTGRLRVTAFLLTFAAFLFAEWTERPLSLVLILAGAALLGAFVHLVRRHRRLRERERRLDAMVELNEEALARLDRRWNDLPVWPEMPDRGKHPYADDLEIVGSTSLERLLNTVTTGPGARTARSWLLEPAERAEVEARQEAVEELAGSVDFRQDLAARARLAGLRREDPVSPFLEWSDGESWLAGRRWLLWGGRLVPLLALALLILQMGGWIVGAWWALGPLLGLVFVGRWGAETGEVMDRVSTEQRSLGSYAEVLERVEEMSADSPRLVRVREMSRAGAEPASEALRRLERWVGIADVRHNDLLHVPLQALFFWDVHVLWFLERWRERSGSHVRSWLRALGEVEALSALSSLRHDHPDWGVPRWADDDRIRATELGHPLLPPDTCVRNDVEVGPPGTFLLLTGSNMSGKSTLLRAIGMNVVLAQAGGPVCARRLEMPTLSPVTSMQIEDSLSEGLSEFMAELRRVAMVVEEARSSAGHRPVLYLLDEPLQGTNEAERRTALRIILGHLLGAGAIGAVATHDLRLHRTEQLESAARAVHFTSHVEEVDGELRLVFDHHLREGPATSTNALDLLRLVGLGEGGNDRRWIRAEEET